MTLASYLVKNGWQVDVFWDDKKIKKKIQERLGGIDIEKVEKREPGFYWDYFTEKEIDSAGRFPLSGEEYYTLLWSAKESVVKALKTGLRIDVRKIEIFPQRFDRETFTNPYIWSSFSCRVSEMDGNWMGFWQMREDFIMTLACRFLNQSEPVSLREIRL